MEIMGKCKVTTLFDGDYWIYGKGIDEIARYVAEDYVDCDDYDTDEEYEAALSEEIERLGMYDTRIWDIASMRREEDLSFAVEDVEHQVECGDDGVLFTGFLGLWDGMYAAGGRAADFRSAVNDIAGRDCEIESITIEDGDVHVTATHHDGRNSFTVRALTEAGSDALHDWECDCGPLAGMFEEEAHRALMGSDEWTHSIAPSY